jgi:hypothetical protein
MSFTPPALAPGALLPLVIEARSISGSMGVMMPTPRPSHLPLFQLVRVVSYLLELRVKTLKFAKFLWCAC